MIKLDGAVVIVTGSASGTGAATALCLAEKGAHVVVNYSRSKEKAEEVASSCSQLGAEVVVQKADVANDRDCRLLAQVALDRWGKIDGLVNNAGTTQFCPHHDLEGLSAADFQRIYGVNTIGPFQMVRAVAPTMQKSGKGAVVNVSSVAGTQSIGSSLAYVGSKGALNAITVALARTLGPEIKVNAVCPGYIESGWHRRGIGEEATDHMVEAMKKTSPLQAISSPKDIADTIVWLLEGAPNITGELFTVDAGMGLLRGGLPAKQ
jgi:3-oxoacyl-[acyl-carrier protein] reductase